MNLKVYQTLDFKEILKYTQNNSIKRFNLIHFEAQRQKITEIFFDSITDQQVTELGFTPTIEKYAEHGMTIYRKLFVLMKKEKVEITQQQILIINELLHKEYRLVMEMTRCGAVER